MTRTIEAADFRQTVGRFASGVTVVTTVVDGTLHGMTANAFASVSLDPLLVLVCVERSAGLHTLLPQSRGFAVTVLAEEQEDASRWFASPWRPGGQGQFDDYRWRPAPVTGSPVLLKGLAYLDCRLTQVHDGGDHSIFLGQVVDLGDLEGTAPLIFYEGEYRAL